MYNVGWGVTHKCNMKCEFCYSKKVRADEADVPVNVMKTFVSENHAKINCINYGTGENSLCDNWFEIIEYVRDNHPSIEQALTTNGNIYYEILQDDHKKNVFLNSIDEIDVSLDFADADRHDKFRGKKNAYEGVINTLRLCREHNIPTTIVFIATNETLEKDNIDGLFKIAKKYGTILRMNIYRPVANIPIKDNPFICDFEKIVDTLYHIDENYKVISINDSLFNALLTDNPIERDPSGSTSLRILPDGSITPSTYLITDEFRDLHISNKNVLSDLSRNKMFNQMKTVNMPEECNLCELKERCGGGVLDRRYLWYKSFDTVDPYCIMKQDNKCINEYPKINTDRPDGFSSVHDGYLPTMFFRP